MIAAINGTNPKPRKIKPIIKVNQKERQRTQQKTSTQHNGTF